MINLVDELQKAYNGDAWHGSNTLSLLLEANPEKVFSHPVPNGHSIAELVLHLIAWTEEAIERVNGKSAQEPARGDWPAPIEMSLTEWNEILNQFKAANQELIEILIDLKSPNWSNEIKDERNPSLGSGVNNAQLINGLIQHHAYHSGQIALLLKF